MNKKIVINLSVAAGLLLAGSLGYLAYDKVISTAGIPTIKIDKSDGYKLLVDGKPTPIRGVCYAPVPVGKDYEYNFWGDTGKPWLGDGKLMKEMGVNTIRFYRAGKNPAEVRQVLDDLYKKFKIRVLMGHYLGFWDWPPPNYADKEFQEKIRGQVLEMVNLYKNSPGVLMWVLGNENNYSFDRNVQRWTTDELDALDPESQRREKAKIYYSYINDLAREIKKVDPRHPVVLGVGETASLEFVQEYAPDIDAIGMIAYRGPGFGNLFRQVQQKSDKPVIMTEWGADSYNAFTREPDEKSQAEFLKLQWQDIQRNMDPKKGVGNCLGGTLFEWTDEWWKGNENLPHTWSVQDTGANWFNASYYFDAQSATRMNMNEEWWGVVSISAQKSPEGNNERLPKKSYSVLKSLWTK
ncbi:MAG: glycoside hydrolase family 2 TIM barrel-domain containing protein [Candidatus Omnitrophota bacterium]